MERFKSEFVRYGNKYPFIQNKRYRNKLTHLVSQKYLLQKKIRYLKFWAKHLTQFNSKDFVCLIKKNKTKQQNKTKKPH